MGTRDQGLPRWRRGLLASLPKMAPRAPLLLSFAPSSNFNTLGHFERGRKIGAGELCCPERCKGGSGSWRSTPVSCSIFSVFLFLFFFFFYLGIKQALIPSVLRKLPGGTAFFVLLRDCNLSFSSGVLALRVVERRSLGLVYMLTQTSSHAHAGAYSFAVRQLFGLWELASICCDIREMSKWMDE